MTLQAQQLLQLLEQRISAMTAMEDSIARASSAMVSCDIDALESQIRDQESLCLQLHSLNQQIDAMRQRQAGRDAAPQSGPEFEPLRLALSRLVQVQQRLKLLNANHAELLRRSRRTINALTNAYQSVALELYSDPAAKPSLHAERA